MVLFFWNGFVPDSLFTCLPIIACILSYHVWCQVVSQKAIFIFVSLRTLLFVLNKTDSKLLQFDYLSSVRIETDVHLKQYLCFLPFQWFFRNAYAHMCALSDLYLVCIYMWRIANVLYCNWISVNKWTWTWTWTWTCDSTWWPMLIIW